MHPTRTPQEQPTPFSRAWRTPRRRLAYAATGVTAAVAGLVVACSDLGPSPAQPGENPAVQPAEGGAATALTPADVAWVGAEHNRGLPVVLKSFVAAYRGRPTPLGDAERCAASDAETRRYFEAHAATAVPAGVAAAVDRDHVADAVLGGARCGAALLANPSLLATARIAANAGATRGLAALSEPSLGVEAQGVIGLLDQKIANFTTAAAFDAELQALEANVPAVVHDPNEIAVVLGTIATARASAYNVEDPCTWTPCGGGSGGGGSGGGSGPPEPPTYQTFRGVSATRVHVAEPHINKQVIGADAGGCIIGGLKAALGGPQAVLVGCFIGGMSGSLSRIASWYITNQL